MIPLRDENPTKRFPFVTVLLIVANVAAFFYELSLPERALFELIDTWAFNPARFVADPVAPEVLISLITAMFLHAGWLHLGGNMLYLWIFGNNIEDRLGRIPFLLFYLGSGVAATLAHVAVEGPVDVPLLGASGAIAGVLGAYLVLYPRTQVLVLIPIFIIIELARVPAAFVIGFWFLMQVAQGIGSISPEASAGGVAWWAHVGGFLAGLLFALPVWLIDRRRRRAKRGRRTGRQARFRSWR